jgi:UDP-glucose 4-epimerase
MNILVIGGKSFIGSNLCKHLAKNGYSVFIGTRSTRTPQLPIDDRYLNKEIYLDLLSTESINNALISINPDVIINLAAVIQENSQNGREMLDVNCVGMYAMLNCCISLKIKPHIIFTSSMSVYNYVDPSYLPVDEKHPLHVYDLYGLSKLFGEQLCDYFSQFGIKITALRISGVYGPNKNKGIIYNCLMSVKSGDIVSVPIERTIRDFVYVDDITQAITKLISYRPKEAYEVFNIGGGVGIDLNDIISNAEKITKTTLNINFIQSDKSSEFYLNINKAKNAFGFEPRDITCGMELFWDFLKSE